MTFSTTARTAIILFILFLLSGQALFAKDQYVTSLGGVTNSLSVDGDLVYVGQGVTLHCYDVSDHADPVKLNSLILNDPINDIALNGTTVYLLMNGHKENTDSLLVFDFSTPDDPVKMGGCPLECDENSRIAYHNNHIYATGTIYVLIADVSNPNAPQYVGQSDIEIDALVFGETTLFCLNHDTDKLISYNLAQPASPVEIGSIDVPQFAYNIAVNGGTLTATDNIQSTAYFYDVTDPANMQHLSTADLANYPLNTAIENDIALFGSTSIEVVDIQDPANPVVKGNLLLDPDFISCADIAVQLPYAYVAGGWSTTSLSIIDLSDPDNPLLAGATEKAPVLIHHMHNVDSLMFIFANDGLWTYNISVPVMPQLLNVSELNSDPGVTFMDGYTLYAGTYAYEVYVYDLSDAGGVVRLSDYNAGRNYKVMAAKDRMLYLVSSDGQHWLEVVDMTGSDGVKLSELELPGEGMSIELHGNSLYIACASADQLIEVDISDPAAPQQINTVSLQGAPTCMGLDSDTLIVGSNDAWIGPYHLESFDVSAAGTLGAINQSSKPGFITDLTMADGSVYMAIRGGSIYAGNYSTLQDVQFVSGMGASSVQFIRGLLSANLYSDFLLAVFGKRIGSIFGEYSLYGIAFIYGLQSMSTVEDGELVIPLRYDLSQNYPNPFNPETTIEYNVVNQGHVSITVYNVMGQRVATLIDQIQSSGDYRIKWNGMTEAGVQATTGIYYYQLRLSGVELVESKKMILIR